MADDKLCAHAGCACPKMEDSDYCSDFCEKAGNSDIVNTQCECGHPGCA